MPPAKVQFFSHMEFALGCKSSFHSSLGRIGLTPTVSPTANASKVTALHACFGRYYSSYSPPDFNPVAVHPSTLYCNAYTTLPDRLRDPAPCARVLTSYIVPRQGCLGRGAVDLRSGLPVKSDVNSNGPGFVDGPARPCQGN